MQTTAAETKLSKTSVSTKLYSSFSIAKVYRKTYKPTLALPGELWQIWFCHLKRSLPFHQQHQPQLSYWGQPVLPGTGVTVRWRWVVLEFLTLILPLLCPLAGCFPENRHKGYLLSFKEWDTSLVPIFLCVGQLFWKVKTSNYFHRLFSSPALYPNRETTLIIFPAQKKIIWKFASDEKPEERMLTTVASSRKFSSV